MQRTCVAGFLLLPTGTDDADDDVVPGGQVTPDPARWHPLDPANASPVVAWLASEESGWLSGAVLRVVGSRIMRMNPWAIDAASWYVARSGEQLDVDVRRCVGCSERCRKALQFG